MLRSFELSSASTNGCPEEGLCGNVQQQAKIAVVALLLVAAGRALDEKVVLKQLPCVLSKFPDVQNDLSLQQDEESTRRGQTTNTGTQEEALHQECRRVARSMRCIPQRHLEL